MEDLGFENAEGEVLDVWVEQNGSLWIQAPESFEVSVEQARELKGLLELFIGDPQ